MARSRVGGRLAATVGSLALAARSLAFQVDKLGGEASAAKPSGADASDLGDGPARPPCAYAWVPSTISSTGWAYDVAIADFDQDGEFDLALAGNYLSPLNDRSGGAVIMHGRGGGVFDWWSGSSLQDMVAMELAVRDLNGDGRPDVVVAQHRAGSLSDGVVAVSFATTTGTLAEGPHFSLSNPVAVEVGDVDGDHVQDIVVVSQGGSPVDDHVVVIRGLGGGAFAEPTHYGASVLRHNTAGRGLAVGDVTGDGIDDVIVGNWGIPAEVSILAGASVGGLRFVSSSRVCDVPWGITLGDFDGDHVRDLAVACNDQNGFMVLTGSPGGFFSSGTLFGLVPDPASIAAADLNSDGLSDIVLVGDGQVGFRLATGGGAFGPAVTEARGSIVKQAGAAVGDLDHDGVPDVVVAGWSSELPIALRGVCR